MASRGSKRSLEEVKDDSQQEHVSNRAKQYDGHDVAVMCARINDADLPVLRELLDKLILNGTIVTATGVAPEVLLGTSRRWSRIKVCEVLQKHFIGLAVPPAMVDQVHSHIQTAAAAAAVAAAPAAAPSHVSLWRSDELGTIPNVLGQWMTPADLLSVSKTSKSTRVGTDKIRDQCLRAGAGLCRQKLMTMSDTDRCFNTCTNHLMEISANFLRNMHAVNNARISFAAKIFDDGVLIMDMYESGSVRFTTRVPYNVHGTAEDQAVMNNKRRWAHMLVAEFEQAAGPPMHSLDALDRGRTLDIVWYHPTQDVSLLTNVKLLIAFMSRWGDMVKSVGHLVPAQRRLVNNLFASMGIIQNNF